MAASTHLTTDDVPTRDRAGQWCEWVSQHFGGLESDLYGDTGFDGRMLASQAGDVILTRLEANRHRVLKTASLARGNDRAYLKIVAPWQGTATVAQHGREACARDGAWVIYDTSGSYEIANPAPVDHLIVMVPREAMTERSLRLDCVMARPLGASGISRVALEAMRNTYQELPHMSEAIARGAGDLITQLVQLSLMEAAGQETVVTQREALRDRVQAYVRQHLRDPNLSVDSIARALNCSRRHLYNAFSGEGESIAAHIQRLRLEACIRDLQQSGPHARPITDIALSWGFGNPSHFSRLFRDHTGKSPSAFRLGG
jgi:AraC-like DNA-binding protein